jgi:deoxyribodipyrimidine photolyase-related protein
MSTVALIFPNQIFWPHPLIQSASASLLDGIFLVEELLFFRECRFHKLKIAFHLATMQSFELRLQSFPKLKIKRISCLHPQADVRLLLPCLAGRGVRKIITIEPDDDWLKSRLTQSCLENGLSIEFKDNPAFINTHRDNQMLLGRKSKALQTDYYIEQRKRHYIMLDPHGKPIGGAWTFDVANRRKLPRHHSVPSPSISPLPHDFQKIVAFVEKHFPDHPGQLTHFPYAVTHEEACKRLEDFLNHRLHDFGAYQDAIEPAHDFLFHSVLTPYLNVGLLTPWQVIEATLKHHSLHPVPLNSLEGFIRQIIGWREFMRAVYHLHGRKMRTRNFWNFTHPMPQAFYRGTTGILPVDDAIRKTLRLAYAHHIERLMILGNFMLLCEIHPDAVYRWFMEHFIDAYDWVMVPNVYAMSQFADGGMITTKPYFSSSNYILKMSSYLPDPSWKEPWDALFWRFMHRQRSFLQTNPRLGMLLKTYDRMPRQKRQALQRTAQAYLQGLHGSS